MLWEWRGKVLPDSLKQVVGFPLSGAFGGSFGRFLASLQARANPRTARSQVFFGATYLIWSKSDQSSLIKMSALLFYSNPCNCGTMLFSTVCVPFDPELVLGTWEQGSNEHPEFVAFMMFFILRQPCCFSSTRTTFAGHLGTGPNTMWSKSFWNKPSWCVCS